MIDDNNNIYFAKEQVNQKGKSPSNLATVLTATKQTKNRKEKLRYKHLDKMLLCGQSSNLHGKSTRFY